MNADDLFKEHVANGLADYRGNLSLVLEAVERDEIPAPTDREVDRYKNQLQNFLAEARRPETDDFLLRFALTVPGRIRGIRPPVTVLSPEHGGFSRKRLEQAAAQIGRLRGALQLGRRVMSNLSPDTLEALRQIARCIEDLLSQTDEWIKKHESLSEEQADLLATRAMECLDAPVESERELGITILCSLAGFRWEGLNGHFGELMQRNIFWPSSLYRNAPDTAAHGLIDKIADAGKLRLNHLLLALAWTRGETARSAFAEWRKRPPSWAASLHVPPEDYLPNAGWTLASNDERRELISFSCHQLVPVEPATLPDVAIPCRTPIPECCSACGSSLGWLFDFSKLPAEFFPSDRKLGPRRLLYCPNCSCFGPVYSRYRDDGAVERHPATQAYQTETIKSGPPCGRGIIVSRRPPFAAAEPSAMPDATSLGGIPMWLQDAEFPRCPDCGDVMCFLAQFDNSAMPRPEEGIFYSFFCGKCRVAAVTYQQT